VSKRRKAFVKHLNGVGQNSGAQGQTNVKLQTVRVKAQLNRYFHGSAGANRDRVHGEA
jgi:hypothetical protein